jgi:hypothetical protein
MKELYSEKETNEIKEEFIQFEKQINNIEKEIIDDGEFDIKRIGLYLGKLCGSYRIITKLLGIYESED